MLSLTPHPPAHQNKKQRQSKSHAFQIKQSTAIKQMKKPVQYNAG